MEPEETGHVLRPEVHESVYIARGAQVFGDVRIAEGASVWFNAVLRGDEGHIKIGRDCNIQDNVLIHSDLGAAVNIAERVTIGHGAVIRSCRIGANVMVGMNATIMSRAEIGENSIVGANSFIPYNRSFPPGSMIVGAPARVVRPLTEEELVFNQAAVDVYKKLVVQYQQGKIEGI